MMLDLDSWWTRTRDEVVGVLGENAKTAAVKAVDNITGGNTVRQEIPVVQPNANTQKAEAQTGLLDQLSGAKVGGVSLAVVALIGVGAYLFFRKR